MNLWKRLASLPFALRAILALLFPFLCAMGVLAWLGKPSAQEFGQISLFMGIEMIPCFLIVYGMRRSGQIQRFSNVHRALFILALSPLLILSILSVITASYVFVDLRDIAIGSALAVLGLGTAAACSYFLFEGWAERILNLNQSASQLAKGVGSIRVPVQGRDEVASLAGTFNQVATIVQDQQRKIERIEALRQDMVAWAGKDLRTPLTVLRAIVDDLQNGEIKDNAAIEDLVHTAQAELDSLAKIVSDVEEITLLDSGSQRPDLRPNSLGHLFSMLVKQFTEPARLIQVAIHGQVEPGVDPVWIDAPRFNRALNNLIGNALQRTPEGGEIKLHAWRANGNVWIKVENTGAGFAAEDLPALFERFSDKSRSEQAMDGKALGLAVAHSIIGAHQGSIEAENIDGGARFLIRLTLTPPGIGASRSIPSTLDEF